MIALHKLRKGEEVVYGAAQLSINMLLRSIQEKIVLLEF